MRLIGDNSAVVSAEEFDGRGVQWLGELMLRHQRVEGSLGCGSVYAQSRTEKAQERGAALPTCKRTALSQA